MNKKKKVIYLFIASLVLACIFSMSPLVPPLKEIQNVPVKNIKSNRPDSNPLISTAKSRQSAPSSQCLEWKNKFPTPVELMKENTAHFIFANVHKKIGPTIYRLRHFFKEGDENEIESFLVYKEDESEIATIIEKSRYKKGALFKQIEASTGETLYQESGHQLSDDLFLYYINNQLDEIHSSIGECHF